MDYIKRVLVLSLEENDWVEVDGYQMPIRKISVKEDLQMFNSSVRISVCTDSGEQEVPISYIAENDVLGKLVFDSNARGYKWFAVVCWTPEEVTLNTHAKYLPNFSDDIYLHDMVENFSKLPKGRLVDIENDNEGYLNITEDLDAFPEYVSRWGVADDIYYNLGEEESLKGTNFWRDMVNSRVYPAAINDGIQPVWRYVLREMKCMLDGNYIVVATEDYKVYKLSKTGKVFLAKLILMNGGS